MSLALSLQRGSAAVCTTLRPTTSGRPAASWARSHQARAPAAASAARSPTRPVVVCASAAVSVETQSFVEAMASQGECIASSITEIQHAEDFTPFVSASELCVVKFATPWCGPCKLVQPEYEKLTESFQSVKFASVDLSSSELEPLGTSMRIRSLPTFRVYRRGRLMEEVTGARTRELRSALTHWYRPS